ncbi:hypothetical protein P8452_14467 [Trifolium repens]|nr:hypothetical protein P8452_14467 [Trifolium repens]
MAESQDRDSSSETRGRIGANNAKSVQVNVSLHPTLVQNKVQQALRLCTKCLVLAMCQSSCPTFQLTTATKQRRLYPMRLRLGYLRIYICKCSSNNTQQQHQMLQQPNFNVAVQPQQHQMLQQPNFNVAVQPVYSKNSYALTNNPMNMNNFNPCFDPTMETAPSSHSLEPFENSWFSQYMKDN